MQRHPAGSLHLGLALVAAVIVLIAPAAYADPPTRAARLAYVTGPVSLAPAGLPDEWGEAFVNRPLTIGDRLWADPGGRAELRLGSTAMRIDGNTSLDILALDDRMLQVSVEQGRAQVRTRGGAGGQAEIDTPAAAIVISSASDVRVDVDPASGRTSVLVRTGRASIHTPNDSFDLASGESTRIDADGRYYSIGRVGQRDAFDQFAYTRDSSWREPRYVSAEMTGYEDLVEHGAWQPTSDYGNVWFPRTVSSDWAPYRDGRWVWVEPWGWTWVDNAPWGFAPFHYGRWVQVGPRWGWWPGERVARPVYAPALVAFFGGDNFGVSVSVGSAPAVGWFPLGYRDPYIPSYTTSPAYRRDLNVAYVRDPVVMNQIVNVNVTNVNVTTVNNFRYAHRERAHAATVVPRNVFVSAQPVRTAAVAVPVQRVASANVVVGAAPVSPERESVIGRPGRAERAPRGERNLKPVVAVNQPAPPPARFEQRRAAEASREPGKPFEVKPLAPRDDRRPDATRSAGATPQAAPGTTAVAPTNREVRVIRAKAPETREARDRGAGKDRDAQAQQAPQPGAAPGTPQTARTAQPSPQQAAQPQGDDRAGQQREAQQREAQQSKATQQREAQERQAQQREAQQREAQQSKATQQREVQERQAQQREAQEREAQQSKATQQREAQERQAQQREAQQREAQQSKATQQREAQERQAQQREAQQREAQQSKATQQREAQERQAQQREAQQREAQQSKATQQREAQERQAQQREAQQREAQQSKATQQREAQERQAQQREAQQSKATQQREAQERQAQQREAQQREAQQSKAAQQREAQQRAAQQREEQKGAAPPPPSSQGQGRGNGNEPQSRTRGTPSEPQAEGRGRSDRDDRGQPDRRG